jgi:hypothetical protein
MGWWSGLRCRPQVQAPVLQKTKTKPKKLPGEIYVTSLKINYFKYN